MKHHELIGAEGKRFIRSPIIIAELDLIHTGREIFDDSSNLTARQAMLRYLLKECNRLE
jgi:hypothetical protein